MTGTKKRALHDIGAWLSAALEDPAVCSKMKEDIELFFEAFSEEFNEVFESTRIVEVDGRVWD